MYKFSKVDKAKVKKNTVKKTKLPIPPKKKVDKSDPNWKLKPNEKVGLLYYCRSYFI